MKLGFGNISSSSGDEGSTDLIFTCDQNPGFEDRIAYAKVYFADDPTKYTTLTVIQRAVDGMTILPYITHMTLLQKITTGDDLYNAAWQRGGGSFGFKVHIVDTTKSIDEYKIIMTTLFYEEDITHSKPEIYKDILWSFDEFMVTNNTVLTIENIIFGFYNDDYGRILDYLRFWNITVSNGTPQSTNLIFMWDLTNVRPTGEAFSLSFPSTTAKVQDGSSELLIEIPLDNPLSLEAYDMASWGLRYIGIQGGYTISLTPRDDIQREKLPVTGNPQITLVNSQNIPVSCTMLFSFEFLNEFDNRVRLFNVDYPFSIEKGSLSYDNGATYYTDQAIADNVDFHKYDLTLYIVEVTGGTPNYEIAVSNDQSRQKISTGDIEAEYSMNIPGSMNISADEEIHLTNTSVPMPDLNTAKAKESFIIDYQITLTIQERTDGDMYVAFRPGTSTEVSIVTAAGYNMTIPQLYIGFRFVISGENVNAGFNFNIEHESPVATHAEYTSSSSTYSLDSYPDTTSVEMTGIVLAVGTTSTGLAGKRFQVANGGAFLDSKLSFNLGGGNYHPDFETFYWNPNTSPNLYHDFNSPITGLTVSDVKSMILVGGITLTAEQA